MNDAEVIRMIREAIPDVMATYRFGSSVSGQAHAGSDVDLAVLAFHQAMREYYGQHASTDELRTYPQPVEVALSSSASNSMTAGGS